MSANAMPPNNYGTNGFTMVTHVVPPQHVVAAGHNGPATGFPAVVPVTHMTNACNVNFLQRFLKGQPKALGTVQIMIGVVTFMYGIVMTVYAQAISVFSGVVYWGPLFYIISGSLTIAADNNLRSCLVKGSLGMNVVSAIAAGTAFILLIVDFVVQRVYCSSYRECELADMYLARSFGISGVQLVLALLQLTISISLSVFACKATCFDVAMVPIVTGVPPAASNFTIMNHYPAQSHPQEVFVTPHPPMPVSNPPTDNPPEYSSSGYKPENSY